MENHKAATIDERMRAHDRLERRADTYCTLSRAQISPALLYVANSVSGGDMEKAREALINAGFIWEGQQHTAWREGLLDEIEKAEQLREGANCMECFQKTPEAKAMRKEWKRKLDSDAKAAATAGTPGALIPAPPQSEQDKKKKKEQ